MAPNHRATLSGVGRQSAITLLLIALTAFFPIAAAAAAAATATATATGAAADPKPTVLDISDRYLYQGCYNETTGVDGAGGARALDGGINEVRKGDMTVQLCLGFCGNGDTEYKYAGLEYSRECWCAQRLSGVSDKLADSECDMGCDGDRQTACGGALKLSVYMLRSAAPSVKVAYGLAAIPMVVTTLLFGLF